MLIRLYRGGVITIFPESTMPLLSQIKFLTDSTGNQLY
jgi:hypothetical protein